MQATSLDGLSVTAVATWQPFLQPVWSDPQGCWCTSDHWVFRYDYATRQLRKVCRLPRKTGGPTALLKDSLARSWLRRRLAPGVGVDTLVALPGGELVLIYDQVYWYAPHLHGSSAEALAFSGQPAFAPPLRGGAAVHPASRCVYFGEYLNGHQRDIRVLRVDVERRCVEVCWSFARSEIKHVHAIHHDRFRNRLWICTGDLDHESAFYYTDDEFQTVHRFAGGDQGWRAIALLFDEAGVEWGMDAGQDAPADAVNRIYRCDVSDETRTQRAVIGNPAYMACDMEDGTAVMQTSFEPRRQQATDEAVGLWWRNGGGDWTPLFGLPYRDRSRGRGTAYGHLLIPRGVSPPGQLLCTPVNTQTHQRRLLMLRWNA